MGKIRIDVYSINEKNSLIEKFSKNFDNVSFRSKEGVRVGMYDGVFRKGVQSKNFPKLEMEKSVPDSYELPYQFTILIDDPNKEYLNNKKQVAIGKIEEIFGSWIGPIKFRVWYYE
jgi:hypothetical protein